MSELSINTVEELCEKICMPNEVTEIISAYDKQFSRELPNAYIDKLFCAATWSDGLLQVKQWLGDDPNGFKILACMLRCCLKTQNYYQAHQISEEIYIDTMKCFSRFVREYKDSYGRYAFDRDFWTVRQISGCLFRIGAMEYELVDETNRRYIAFHVPSDICFAEQHILNSFFQARDFFQEKFPEYGPIATRGGISWLRSPTLKKLLPKDSNILKYQKLFIIDRVSSPCNYKRWVFKRDDLPLNELPEDTLLQRNLKHYLQSGGTVVNATGYLKRTVFDPPSIWNSHYVKDYLLDRFDKVKRLLWRVLILVEKCFFHPLPVKAFLQTTSRGMINNVYLCKKKLVALTFDDGNHLTPQLLDQLNQYHIKSTFFIQGTQLKEQYAMFQQVIDAGHEICNHSYHHFNMTKLSEEEIFQQLDQTQQLLKKLSGKDNRLFRPPYGRWNKSIGKIARGLGLICVGWSVDSRDWEGISAEKIYKNIMESGQIRNGAIIILHTHGQHTVEALDLVVPALKKLGYEIVTVSELLNAIPLYRYRLNHLKPLSIKWH